MKRVNSYDEISSLISMQIKKGVITNNFLGEDDLKFEIKNENLYYILLNNGLIILRDRETHYILNYYINDFNDLWNFEFDKDVVVEIVFRNGDEKFKNILSFFERHKFEEYLRRIRLAKTEYIAEEIYNEIKLASLEDNDEIFNLLTSNFDKYSGCIPSKKRIIEDIQNKNIYVFKDEIIKGVLRINKNNMSSEIKHLVVDKESRRQKIAQCLVLKYFEDIDAKRKTVWTGIENEIAINFYKKMGYTIDKYNSIVLIKRREIKNG